MAGKTELFQDILQRLMKQTGKSESELAQLSEKELSQLASEGNALVPAGPRKSTIPLFDKVEKGRIGITEKGNATSPKFSSGKEETGLIPSGDLKTGQNLFDKVEKGRIGITELGGAKEPNFTPMNQETGLVKSQNRQPLFDRMKEKPSGEIIDATVIEPETKGGMSKKKLAAGAALLGGAAYGLGGEKSLKAQSLQGEETETPKTIPADKISNKTTLGAMTKATLDAPHKINDIDIKTLFDQAQKQVGEAPKAQRDAFRKELDSLQDMRNKAVELYKSDIDKTQWAGVVETIGQAFAQLGAGMQGLSSGVNMSGLTFNKHDWSQNFKALKDTFDADTENYGVQSKDLKDRQGSMDKQYSDEKDSYDKRLSDRLAALYKEKADKRNLSEDAFQKEAGRQNNLEIAKIGANSREAVADKKGNGSDKDAAKIETAKQNFIASLRNIENLPKSKREMVIKEIPKLGTAAGFTAAQIDELMKKAESGQMIGQDFNAAADAALNMSGSSSGSNGTNNTSPPPSPGAVAQPSQSDAMALEWLRKNPTSPQAAAVKQKLQAKGLL